MAKTITRRGKHTTRLTHRNGHHRVAQDVERIIKKAMRQTAAYNIKNRVKNFLANSLENAKDKTETIHEDVANYTYRKPLTSLGLAMLTGAAIALIVKASNHTHHRRKFFG